MIKSSPRHGPWRHSGYITVAGELIGYREQGEYPGSGAGYPDAANTADY
jgi:hypothetical protein